METGSNKNFFFEGICLAVLERLDLAIAIDRATGTDILLSPLISGSAADRWNLVGSNEWISNITQGAASFADWIGLLMDMQDFGLIELPFSRMPNTYFFILCHKAVIVNFAKGGDQVEADHIALAVDDTEGVTLPLAVCHPVYIAFAVMAASAAAVVIYVAGGVRFHLGRLPRSVLTHKLSEPSSQLSNAPGFITW